MGSTTTAGLAPVTIRRIRRTAAREVIFPDGTAVLFSYGTPVAFYLEVGGLDFGAGYYRTELAYSTSTTRHVRSWPGARGDGPRGYSDVVSYAEIVGVLAEHLPEWRSLGFRSEYSALAPKLLGSSAYSRPRAGL